MQTSSTEIRQAEGVAERMHSAVHALATGKGDVRTRLQVAGTILLALQVNDFPCSLQSQFKTVMERLTRHDASPDLGRLQVTLYRMQNVTGARVAADIFALYESIQKLRGRTVP